jgi:hypothetical protein
MFLPLLSIYLQSPQQLCSILQHDDNKESCNLLDVTNHFYPSCMILHFIYCRMENKLFYFILFIYSLAAAISAKEAAEVRVPAFRRGELNMEIDTLSERSEEEEDGGEGEKQRRPLRGRRLSGKKRSLSR